MNTLADIINLGNAAADAGNPIVTNWPQMRGALCILGRIGGGLDRVQTSDFEVRFPIDFDALDPIEQAAYPSERTYNVVRLQVSRMLASLGEIDDPWEQLRMLIQRAGREDIKRCLSGLATPAKAAGLAPADIRTDWVWSLDAERGVLTDEQLQRRAKRDRRKPPKVKLAHSVRQRLRRGVKVFNALFDLPEIARSGLLPPAPIGPPPNYDREGRRIYHLPPTLTRYQDAAQKVPRVGLPQIWQAMCASQAFDMPEDPVADDLLEKETWQRISQLPEQVTGVSDATWQQYVRRVRRVLLPHVTLPVPEHLPEWLEVMIATHGDRWPLQAMWRLMCSRNMTNAEPDDLLHLATWRELWRKMPQNTAASSWRQYESRARKILAQHAIHQGDPYRVVTRAWTNLPKGAKVALDPIRKQAEHCLMRPLDLTPEWVTAQDLEPAQETQVVGALRQAFFAAAQIQKAAVPNPVSAAWQALRTAIQAQGISTLGLIKVAAPAIEGGLAPLDLTPAWAAATAAQMDYRGRAKFAAALRKFDGLMSIPELKKLLCAEPISALPDARKGGKVDPPAAMLRELENLHEAADRASSTRREGRALLRKLWNAAVSQGMEVRTLSDLLQAETILADLNRKQVNKATNLLQDLRRLELNKAVTG